VLERPFLQTVFSFEINNNTVKLRLTKQIINIDDNIYNENIFIA